MYSNNIAYKAMTITSITGIIKKKNINCEIKQKKYDKSDKILLITTTAETKRATIKAKELNLHNSAVCLKLVNMQSSKFRCKDLQVCNKKFNK